MMVSVADSPKIGAQKYNYAHNPSGSAYAEPPPFTQGRLDTSLYAALSFSLCSSPYSGDPSGADAPAPLEGAPRRGKDLYLAAYIPYHRQLPETPSGAPGSGVCRIFFVSGSPARWSCPVGTGGCLVLSLFFFDMLFPPDFVFFFGWGGTAQRPSPTG